MALWQCECRPCARVPPAWVARIAANVSLSLCHMCNLAEWTHAMPRDLCGPQPVRCSPCKVPAASRTKIDTWESQDCPISRRGRRSPERRDKVRFACIRDMKEPACHEPVTSKWVKAHRGRSTERFCGVVVLATHQAVQRTQAHGETEPGHELLCVCMCEWLCVCALFL